MTFATSTPFGWTPRRKGGGPQKLGIFSARLMLIRLCIAARSNFFLLGIGQLRDSVGGDVCRSPEVPALVAQMRLVGRVVPLLTGSGLSTCWTPHLGQSRIMSIGTRLSVPTSRPPFCSTL